MVAIGVGCLGIRPDIEMAKNSTHEMDGNNKDFIVASLVCTYGKFVVLHSA